ncbi:MAG: methyltransferase domain-containing protein [Thermoleophilia bacterium]|nr:methyltransferase domain-containing protein [Thermoleophilia bacterium]
MTVGEAPGFDRLAGDYDRLRPADAAWQAVLEAVWTEGDLAGRRVLDVGCGTGRLATELARRGARVWGVDRSEEMLAEARRRAGPTVGLKQGGAEALPFRDGWFERAVLRLVVHLVDRGRALPEVRRVLAPTGRAVVATFRPEHFDRIWLARFFPSLAGIDRARFPEPPTLARELEGAGFASVRTVAVSQPASVRREDALERLRGRYISTLWLLPEDEYQAGVARAERELGPVTAYSLEWAIVVATA